VHRPAGRTGWREGFACDLLQLRSFLMPQTHLVACPSCARHVRVSEPACPFCKGTLSKALRETPERQGPAMRLSRGALYSFGVGALAVATACSSSSPVQVAILYGAPPGSECAFPDGVELGGDCTGDVFVSSLHCGAIGTCDSGIVYASCKDGSWAFTCTYPGPDPGGIEQSSDGSVDSAADARD
jgi:hypothetical protein